MTATIAARGTRAAWPARSTSRRTAADSRLPPEERRRQAEPGPRAGRRPSHITTPVAPLIAASSHSVRRRNMDESDTVIEAPPAGAAGRHQCQCAHAPMVAILPDAHALSITSEVMAAATDGLLSSRHHGNPGVIGGSAAARVATTPALEPAGAGLRSGGLEPARELSRDGPRAAQPRDGAPAGRTARRAAPRTQHLADRCRLRARLSPSARWRIPRSTSHARPWISS